MASKFRLIKCAALLTATGAHAEGASGPWQNLDAVDEAVAAKIGATGAARAIDRRIKLARCPETPTVTAPYGGSVTVSCGTIGWRIRVPVTVTMLAATGPLLMRKGDPVSVVTGDVGFSASITGVADGEGRLGERVRVKTGPGSAAIVGLIADPGTVRIY